MKGNGCGLFNMLSLNFRGGRGELGGRLQVTVNGKPDVIPSNY